MTRQDYIKAVKAKLDEISPFDEPVDESLNQAFIAADGDEDYKDVKPVVSYIESELDNAAKFCLNILPTTLLAEDIDSDNVCVHVDKRGVGHIHDMYDYFRLIRLDCGEFERDITSFISSNSPKYLLQQNEFTRGGTAKPVAAFVPEKSEVEVFSFKEEKNNVCVYAKLTYIDCHVAAERVSSNISNFIVIRCAMNVARILGDDGSVTRLTNEFQEAVGPVLS